MKKRQRNQRKKTRQNTGGGFRVVAPYPPRRDATFKYVGTVSLTETAAGVGTQWSWALNGLYDPDVTFVGHQPMYFDQLVSALGPYYRYTVYETSVKLTVSNMTANAVLFAYYEQPGAIDLPSRESVLEKAMVRYQVLSPNTGGVSTKILQTRVPIAKGLGVTRQRLISDDQYSGPYNANPTQILYGILMAYSLPPSATVATVSVVVEVVFRAKLFALVAASQS